MKGPSENQKIHLPAHPDYQLLQLKYLTCPWRATVACILLNRTKRKQVDGVIETLFTLHPHYISLASAHQGDLASLLRPLGFHNRRAKTLIKFSEDYMVHQHFEMRWPTIKEIKKMHGVGEYAADSYRIFFANDWHFMPKDKELKEYAAYLRRKEKS